MPVLLDIAEVAVRSGLAPSALRFYEKRGLIAPAGRNGLRRTYRPDCSMSGAESSVFTMLKKFRSPG